MSKSREFIKRVGYSIGANLLSLFVSLLTTLLVPKFLGAEIGQYGYLQIYLFYVSYIGFFHLGLCDGIYLRDAGKHYNELDKPLYSSQFWILSAFSVFVASGIAIYGGIFSQNEDYSFIFFMIALNVLIYLPRTMLQYYLQTTNRIKEYASITTIGRAIYGVELISIFVICSANYRVIVFADLLAKAIALSVAVYWCRDIVFCKPAKFGSGFRECVTNISVGIKLLFANIASMLITGIVRWGIEQQWDVVTYGKISFSLSVSQFLLTFISAVALVLYPTLRRTDKDKLSGLYGQIRDILMLPLLGCMMLYYPVEIILSAWLPQYAESMQYMAILFPLCIYAAKMTLLIQTYMNVHRMERTALVVNLIGVGFAIVTTIVSVFILKDLRAAMLSVVLNQMFRCVIAEFVLSRKINVYVTRDVLEEIILTIIFIAANWFIGGWKGVAVYAMAFAVYCLVEKRKISGVFKYAKNMLKK